MTLTGAAPSMAGAEVPADERRRAQPGRTEPGSLALSSPARSWTWATHRTHSWSRGLKLRNVTLGGAKCALESKAPKFTRGFFRALLRFLASQLSRHFRSGVTL